MLHCKSKTEKLVPFKSASHIVWLATPLRGRDCTPMRYREFFERKCYDVL